jgi:hypothetical protein
MGRLGMSNLASWVEYMIMVPFGLTITMGWVVGRLFKTVAVTVQEWAGVLPLLAMPSESVGGTFKYCRWAKIRVPPYNIRLVCRCQSYGYSRLPLLSGWGKSM